NSSSPALTLSNDVMRSEVYGIPPKSDQKPGDFPLGQCINDTTIVTPFGTGCWNLFFTAEPAHDEVISHPDSNDTRMQQVWYAQDRVWGALDTVVKVNGQERAGIAYFVVKANVEHGSVHADIDEQGYVALKNNNVTYPAIAVLPNGKGIMAFSLMGQDYHPSAAYVTIKNKKSFSDIHVAAAGLGVDDGFTSYKAFVGDPPRTRWGDYGAAVTDGNNVWFASEYIGQTCTLEEYLTGSIGSCGGTRTALANWGTRISGVKP
ncbi:MAG TPA: hypothetical protein VLE49_10590, partial [Anaerolineales bacterium]|nr:hypothetical protein [Anaerolineales bacterium]